MLTDPATLAPPEILARVKLEIFKVELIIGSENVADNGASINTPVWPAVGEVVVTVGAVTSAAAVWKLQT